MKRYIGLLIAAMLLTGCSWHESVPAGPSQSDNGAPNSISVFAMDTFMEMTAYGGNDALMYDAEQRILELESLLSVTDKNSEIHTLNQNGEAALSADTEELMQQALEMCTRTHGSLDISIYPVLRAWGFTTGSYQIPDSDTLSELLARVDYREISLNNGTAVIPDGMELDLGSVAKGYAGDQVAELLREMA